ncbi:hypothetical protein RCH14_004766 [Massilia sp. MP_M2]|uniref:hypothetical protein n=1 Tax=Massilia sp. MP_M2 TaxID=3071713 RepID=UPI00319E5C08
MNRNKLLPAVALALSIVSSLAAAGPVTGGAWAWASGKITNNGSVQLKSANGTATYNAVQNPTGVMVKSNQSALTQPPAVLISGRLPCYVGMQPKNRLKYCSIGSDVLAGADSETIVGKYGGFTTVRTRTGTKAKPTYGTYTYDFVVEANDRIGKFSCPYSSEGVANAKETLYSVMSIMGYVLPPGYDGGTWFQMENSGIFLSTEFVYYMRDQKQCNNIDLTSPELFPATITCYQKGKGWYMPSTNELASMRQNQSALGGFSNAVYLSSEGDNGGAYSLALDFSSGAVVSAYRYDDRRFRCLRVFDDMMR